jgi:hypothetical protein
MASAIQERVAAARIRLGAVLIFPQGRWTVSKVERLGEKSVAIFARGPGIVANKCAVFNHRRTTPLLIERAAERR